MDIFDNKHDNPPTSTLLVMSQNFMDNFQRLSFSLKPFTLSFVMVPALSALLNTEDLCGVFLHFCSFSQWAAGVETLCATGWRHMFIFLKSLIGLSDSLYTIDIHSLDGCLITSYKCLLLAKISIKLLKTRFIFKVKKSNTFSKKTQL